MQSHRRRGSFEIDRSPHYSVLLRFVRLHLATYVGIAREYMYITQIVSHGCNDLLMISTNPDLCYFRVSLIIGFVHSQTRTLAAWKKFFQNQDVSSLSLSLSPPLFLILPGVASVSGAVIYHPPLGVAAGVEAKNLTEQKLSSVLGKAS